MSSHSERFEAESSAGTRSEADAFESSLYTSSIKVEWHRSFEYCVKWSVAMAPRRSARSTRASEKKSQSGPSPKKKVVPHRTKGRTQRTGLRKNKAHESVVEKNDEGVRDIIDIINSMHEAKQASTDEGVLAEVAPGGGSDSEEDRCSVSSVASGPSGLQNTNNDKRRLSPGMCSACQKIHQKTKKMKAPVKDKLSDNDPSSLTCDEWVLIKTWRPRRTPSFDGRLLKHIHLIKKRLVSKDAMLEEERPSACSRPHTFLQRNLRKGMTGVPNIRRGTKSRRKRSRKDSLGPRVAKQQRLSSGKNDPRGGDRPSLEMTDNSGVDLGSSSSRFEGMSEQELDDPDDTHMTIELVSSEVTLEKPTKSTKVQPRQKAAKKTAGFRDLLAQMRGNSSMIVRETR